MHGLVRFPGILAITGTDPYMKARVEVLADVIPPPSPDFALLVKSVRQAATRMIELSPNVPEEANVVLNNHIEAPGTLAGFYWRPISLRRFSGEAIDTRRDRCDPPAGACARTIGVAY